MGLLLGTHNLSDATVAQVLDLTRVTDVMGLQEASDRQDVLTALYAEGYGIVRSHGPGGKATPLAYRKDALRLIRRIDRPLMGAVWVGAGPGPDRLKPKHATGAVFEHLESGRRVKVVNVHMVAGQSSRRRRRIARRMVVRLAGIMARQLRRRADFILGDFNTQPTSPTLAPLVAAGYKCTHLELEFTPTFGDHWAPDQVWGRAKGGLRFTWVAARRTKSDHRAILTFAYLRGGRK